MCKIRLQPNDTIFQNKKLKSVKIPKYFKAIKIISSIKSFVEVCLVCCTFSSSRIDNVTRDKVLASVCSDLGGKVRTWSISRPLKHFNYICSSIWSLCGHKIAEQEYLGPGPFAGLAGENKLKSPT